MFCVITVAKKKTFVALLLIFILVFVVFNCNQLAGNLERDSRKLVVLAKK